MTRLRQANRVAIRIVGCLMLAASGMCSEARVRPATSAALSRGPDRSETTVALAAAERLLATGDRQRARTAYQRALALAARSGDRRLRAAAYAGLGDSLDPLRDGRQALDSYRRSVALADGVARQRAWARVRLAEGAQATGRGDLAGAEAGFDRALVLAERCGDRRLIARVHLALGSVRCHQDRYAEAEQHYAASLELVAGTPDRRAMAYAARGVSAARFGRADFTGALAALEKALAAARSLGDGDLKGDILNKIGSIYLEWADYVPAQRYCAAALASRPSPQVTGYALNNLGLVLGNLGEAELSIDHFQRALDLFRETGDAYGTSRALGNLSSALQDRGDFGRASALLSQALATAQRAGDRSAVAQGWMSIGDLRAAEGRPEEALAAYRRCQQIAESLGDRSGGAAALAGRASVHLARGNAAAALALAHRAATAAARLGDRELFWQARTTAGEALRASGQTRQAARALQDAIVTIEEVRSELPAAGPLRRGFLAGRLKPYRTAMALAAERGDALGALAYAERAKARALLDLLYSRQAGRAPDASATERARESRLGEQLVAINEKLFLARQEGAARERRGELEAALKRLRLELEACRARLYADPREAKGERVDLPPFTPNVTRDLTVSGGTTYLEYAVLDDRTLLFALRPSGRGRPANLDVYSIHATRRELTLTVEAFRRGLGARNLDFEPAARRLHDLLLPAAAEIRGAERLCIVPDGVLWNLPFQALAPAAGEVLLDRHTITYAPSLALLREILAHRSAPAGGSWRENLLALGNPALGRLPSSAAAPRGGALAPLPETEGEVRELGRLYGPGSRVLVGGGASERAVKKEAGRFRVLHFATHGVFDDASPMYSHLVLSQARPEEGEDGLLEAWEIANLNLDADLVVLAACETARGELAAGEGLMGLSWAFFAAGSRAIVASQWPIDSAAASRLMIELHRGLLAGYERAEALRRAAIALREEPATRHPYYWASFVLLGDGGAMRLRAAVRQASVPAKTK